MYISILFIVVSTCVLVNIRIYVYNMLCISLECTQTCVQVKGHVSHNVNWYEKITEKYWSLCQQMVNMFNMNLFHCDYSTMNEKANTLPVKRGRIHCASKVSQFSCLWKDSTCIFSVVKQVSD